MMSRRTGIALAIMVVAGLVGCGRPVSLDQGPAGPPPTEDTARMRQQAQDALARWDAAVKAAGGSTMYVPVRGQSFISDWKPEVGEKYKGSITNGRVELSGVDPALTLPSGKITWADGTTLEAKTMTTGEAVALFKAHSGRCEGCNDPIAPLTRALPTTIKVETTRGLAEVPAWMFRIADTDAWISQGAVAVGVQLAEPPWDSTNPPVGISIEKAAVEPGGRRLTVTIPGSPGSSKEPCGADYTAEAIESANAVAVIVHSVSYEQAHPGEGLPRACPAIGAFRQATVDLAEPLGNRAVLESRTGMPVPLGPN